MKQLILLSATFLIVMQSFSQNKYTISGFIKDEAGEELIGATIYIPSLNSGAVANAYG